jgi:hypothetical protein
VNQHLKTITKTEILKKNIQYQFNNFMKKILIIITLFLSTQIYSQSTPVDKLPEPMEYGQKIYYTKEGNLIVETKKNLSQEDIETVKKYVKTYYVKYDWSSPEIFDKSFFSKKEILRFYKIKK